MELIRRIRSEYPLDMSSKIVPFLKGLKEYEIWIAQNSFVTSLPPALDEPGRKLFRPYIDEALPLQDTREFAWVLGLNTKLQAVFIDLVSIGDVHKTQVPIISVFRGTFISEASTIVFLHNHPSGDVKPSPADIKFTERLVRAGILLNRPLYDHIIIGNGDDYFSFHEGNLNKDEETVLDSIENKILDEPMELNRLKLLTKKQKHELDKKEAKIAKLEAELKKINRK